MSMRNKLSALAFIALLTPVPALADAAGGEALLTKNRCVACHDTTKNLLGPSYKAIAARHAAQKETMIEVLAQKIIAGGAGNWGVVPMVPNEHVSLEEARAMSRWILGLQ